ncbi:von Willebrand factor type A (vWA) domain-containing protein [Bifidobacterium sp. DSM 109958]|uniref:von Willebrand factor type A (VWA) domain-containing protein n=1 Tax=Bifidobacterium moraviense TaxID=2675323 RepID=A0A7Y0F2T6_9BIFI|nr:von Willebrand factor type A (vWA) domain-containing protein [Bifidobacterium sp. DSM 109958]
MAAIAAGAMALGAAACSFGTDDNTNTANQDASKVQTFQPNGRKATATLNIASGSENREVAAAVQKAADESGVAVTLNYMGSLDVMSALENGGENYDAVWPASSMWISMGDVKHLVKNQTSTSTTPVVFGIAKSKAVELGWADASGKTRAVGTTDIIDAVTAGKLRFSMTSATQSNSGASAYLAFATALAGTNQPLTAANLDDDALRAKLIALLKGVDRSSGSSDWLKDMVVANPDRFDAMVNYESLVIQADKQLTQNGHDPLLAVYPADGIAVSDSPLGYVDRGQKLDAAFADFVKALQSDDAKLEFERAGRRTGLGGTLTYASDAQVQQAFKADWGITTEASALRTIPLPAADVIRTSLDVYQTALRKPSYTIWVVDYSGSMSGDGKNGVVAGLQAALDPAQARQSHIEPSSKDVNVFIPFASQASQPITANGTDTAALLAAASERAAAGGTDIYDGLDRALDNLPADVTAYTTAIVLMTDGQSVTNHQSQFESTYRERGKDLPIFSIMFGEADPAQLDAIASLSNAKVFDGRTGGLASVFRQVKGYN